MKNLALSLKNGFQAVNEILRRFAPQTCPEPVEGMTSQNLSDSMLLISGENVSVGFRFSEQGLMGADHSYPPLTHNDD